MIEQSFGHFSSAIPDISGIIAMATFMPEALILCSAIVFLLGGVFAQNKQTDRFICGVAIFMLISLLGVMTIPQLPAMRGEYFSHMFVADGFSHVVKVLLALGSTLVFLLSAGWLNRGDNQQFEFPVLMLFSLLGSMLMVSANNLLSLYVGLELSSLPLYVLAAMRREELKSTEAGLKYFVLGALASGLLLFGISLVYGFSGTTGFDALAELYPKNSSSLAVPAGSVVGLVLILAALSFKISAAPFHMWTPDVYEGAPTPVTAFFSIVPKLAALALLIRVICQPFGALLPQWQPIIICISVASMLVGAFGALWQTNIKRLLAYSSIGHIGYALVGLSAGNAEGVSGVLIYFTLYIFMSAGAFACILMMNNAGDSLENISDLAGLSRTRPRMAFALAAFMFSMAGIPPFSGFFAKLYVFLAALHAGLVVLAVIGVIASVVACYYYLKVVKIMYFDEPTVTFDKKAALGTRVVSIVCATVTGLFFLMPGPLVTVCKSAADTLFERL